MARSFKPNAPFDVAMKLLVHETVKVKGVVKKIYRDTVESHFEYPFSINRNDPVEFSRFMAYIDTLPTFFGSFKTYGGTENFSNNIYMVFDTAVIETWYDPRFASDCQIYICETQRLYNIITRPENINMRHQFVQFKVENVGGKA